MLIIMNLGLTILNVAFTVNNYLNQDYGLAIANSFAAGVAFTAAIAIWINKN